MNKNPHNSHPSAHTHPRDQASAPTEPSYPAHREHAAINPKEVRGPRRSAHHEHDKHAGHSVKMFRDKFWVTLLLMLPTLFWGHMLPSILSYTPPGFPGSRWIAPIFGTAVFVYGGVIFIKGAIAELRLRAPGMMTLIALAITVAFGFSAAVTLGFAGMPLWEELATLVTIMVLGHWIEMRSISQAKGALKELAKLLPATALRITDSITEEIQISEIRESDVLLVRPGAAVPADGIVTSGSSSVNESMITGESRPVKKEENEKVIAGSVNGTGSLHIRVTRTGETTALAGIMRLVEQAQASRSRAQALADRAAFVLTIVALAAAITTLIAWLAAGAEPAFAVERVVTTLVISCPHALGLAVPLVIAISTTLAARNGLLIRDRRGLEEARKLHAVIFDKTGTLTVGEQRVVEMQTAQGLSSDEALALAAAIESDSEHPVARAIQASARDRGTAIPAVSDFSSLTGRGVSARVNGRELFGGGPNLLRFREVTPPEDVTTFADRAAQRGQSVIYLIEDRAVIATFAIADQIRPESREAVEHLHRQGIEVVMMTGDARAVAAAVAAELNIDTVFAEVLPEQKSAKIRELQQQGKRVAMVGDGVNDAPALVTADVGVAIGAGTDVAVEAGDVVLVRSDPRDIPRIISLSKATYRKMIQNLWWAAGYNVVAIPLAAGVLANRGIILSPAIGAVLMSASTVIVAINAQLLRRSRL